MTVADVIEYFAADPLRALYVLGGAGGAWFWLEKWLNRTRLEVRLLSYSIEGSDHNPMAKILIEAENLGARPTSLAPHVQARGYRKRRRGRTVTLEVVDSDRQLQPHAPRRLTIVGSVPQEYLFWMYKRFHIALSRGRGRTIYLRTSSKETLGIWRYVCELFLYRAFGALPFVGLGLQSMDDA